MFHRRITTVGADGRLRKRVGGHGDRNGKGRRGRPPAIDLNGHDTTKRYTLDKTAAAPLQRVAIHAAAGAISVDGL